MYAFCFLSGSEVAGNSWVRSLLLFLGMQQSDGVTVTMAHGLATGYAACRKETPSLPELATVASGPEGSALEWARSLLPLTWYSRFGESPESDSGRQAEELVLSLTGAKVKGRLRSLLELCAMRK